MKQLILLVFLCSQSFLVAQQDIQGYILNNDKEPLIGATVVLLDQDSTLVAFSLTNQKGMFALTDIEKATYFLQVSYISYANHSQKLDIEWTEKIVSLEPIILNESSEVLQEITIKAEHIPMGLKGDTISYNASAFKTRPNATVEDLLKKLPGIEVDRNGNIKAQGEDVKNVLVEGKEFFGKDPKMATKNLSAEALDKVEVFDKKSDIEEFTGIDDGKEEKTINLKLKEDHKKGGFGNAKLAGGTKETYESRLNYFRFTPSLQASLILASNNINKETFTINDRIDFMGGMMNAMAGGVLNLSELEGLKDGINSSTSIGSNLNYDFSPKLKVSSFYTVNQIKNDLKKQSISQNFTDQFNYNNTDDLRSKYNSRSHKINTKLTYKLNPLLELIFKNNLTWSTENTLRNLYSQFFRSQMDEGFSSSDLTSEEKDWQYETEIFIKKKFIKKGRNIISNFTYQNGKQLTFDNIHNQNFIAENSLDIRQDQDFVNVHSAFSFSSDYTEPLSKKIYLTLKYKYGVSNERPNRNYYDLQDGFSLLNEILSADYLKSYQYNIAGIALKRNSARLKINLGLLGQFTSLSGIIDHGAQSINGKFQHLLPSLSLTYDFKGNGRFDSNYNTRVTAPKLEQLLPLPNNSNANYEFIGNPNLIPAYEQNFRIGYNYFDYFSFTNFWISARLNKTNNRIVTKSNIDDNLFRTIQPINVDHYQSLNLYANFSKPFKPLSINYTIRLSASLAEYESFINDLSSAVSDKNYNARISIVNRKTDYAEVETGFNLDFNTKKYGINTDFNTNYSNTDFFINAEFYLPKAWIIGSDFNFQYYSNESFSENTSFALWNITLSKYFLENRLEVSLSAFDMLNENIGFSRSGSINSLRQESYNNLSRYFLVGAHYKIGKGKSQNIQIETNN